MDNMDVIMSYCSDPDCTTCLWMRRARQAEQALLDIVVENGQLRARITQIEAFRDALEADRQEADFRIAHLETEIGDLRAVLDEHERGA